jgi:hypothetical protein
MNVKDKITDFFIGQVIPIFIIICMIVLFCFGCAIIDGIYTALKLFVIKKFGFLKGIL